MAFQPTRLRSKYLSTCPLCQGSIAIGEDVYWKRGRGVWHVQCPEAAPSVPAEPERDLLDRLASGEKPNDYELLDDLGRRWKGTFGFRRWPSNMKVFSTIAPDSYWTISDMATFGGGPIIGIGSTSEAAYIDARERNNKPVPWIVKLTPACQARQSEGLEKLARMYEKHGHGRHFSPYVSYKPKLELRDDELIIDGNDFNLMDIENFARKLKLDVDVTLEGT